MKQTQNASDRKPLDRPVRQPWERPEARLVGRVSEVLGGGGGKVSILTGDPGEPRKVPSKD